MRHCCRTATLLLLLCGLPGWRLLPSLRLLAAASCLRPHFRRPISKLAHSCCLGPTPWLLPARRARWVQAWHGGALTAATAASLLCRWRQLLLVLCCAPTCALCTACPAIVLFCCSRPAPLAPSWLALSAAAAGLGIACACGISRCRRAAN